MLLGPAISDAGMGVRAAGGGVGPLMRGVDRLVMSGYVNLPLVTGTWYVRGGTLGVTNAVRRALGVAGEAGFADDPRSRITPESPTCRAHDSNPPRSRHGECTRSTSRVRITLALDY